MSARIYQPPKTAMQSGRGKAHEWVLEFVSNSALRPDPLMGWIGGGDTQTQVRLNFPTKEEAIAYARRSNLRYEVELPQERRIRPKAYADNFRWGRPELWTH
jgi:hypothetical protein